MGRAGYQLYPCSSSECIPWHTSFYVHLTNCGHWNIGIGMGNEISTAGCGWDCVPGGNGIERSNSDDYKVLLHGIAIVAGYLVPGYLLNKKDA